VFANETDETKGNWVAAATTIATPVGKGQWCLFSCHTGNVTCGISGQYIFGFSC
jgi:hypothetical protein